MAIKHGVRIGCYWVNPRALRADSNMLVCTQEYFQAKTLPSPSPCSKPRILLYSSYDHFSMTQRSLFPECLSKSHPDKKGQTEETIKLSAARCGEAGTGQVMGWIPRGLEDADF